MADLLANKSWCKAVWGEKRLKKKDGCCEPWPCDDECWGLDYKENSTKAFQILQQEGEEECLKYILKTII